MSELFARTRAKVKANHRKSQGQTTRVLTWCARPPGRNTQSNQRVAASTQGGVQVPWRSRPGSQAERRRCHRESAGKRSNNECSALIVSRNHDVCYHQIGATKYYQVYLADCCLKIKYTGLCQYCNHKTRRAMDVLSPSISKYENANRVWHQQGAVLK